LLQQLPPSPAAPACIASCGPSSAPAAAAQKAGTMVSPTNCKQNHSHSVAHRLFKHDIAVKGLAEQCAYAVHGGSLCQVLA
jgi:hypothetical protein